MPSYKVTIHDHSIEIWFSWWSGREIIRYDGQVVSEKRSFRLITEHSFKVEEDNQLTHYEVRNGGILGYSIRRKGVKASVHHRPVLRYLTAAGLIMIALIGLDIILNLLSLVAPRYEPQLTTARGYLQYVNELVALLGGLVLWMWLKKQVQGSNSTGST